MKKGRKCGKGGSRGGWEKAGARGRSGYLRGEKRKGAEGAKGQRRVGEEWT